MRDPTMTGGAAAVPAATAEAMVVGPLAAAPSPPPARAAERIPFGTVLLSGSLSALAPMSTDMYLPALPRLSASFGHPAEPTLGAFLIGVAASQFVYGPLSDRIGRRKPMLAGLALYVLATLACAAMTTLPGMIAARFVQAMGAGAGSVLARAAIKDRFDEQSSARVLSMLILVTGLGPILAPMVGALLVSLGWQAIFVVQALIGSLILACALARFAETHPPERAATMRSESVLASFAILLRSRRIVGFTLAGAFNGAALFAYVASASTVFIGVYRVTPLTFAWIFGANAIGLVATGQLNAWLLKRYRPAYILVRARLLTLLFAVALAGIAVSGLGGFPAMFVALFLVVASFGVVGPNTLACSLSLDRRRTGAISSLMGAATFGASATMTVLVGYTHDGTVRPLAYLVLGSIILSSLALYLLARPAALPEASPTS